MSHCTRTCAGSRPRSARLSSGSRARRRSRVSRRYGMPDAPTLDALLEQVTALPIERTAIVARAFTLFFLLINTAEQVHRVRRRNQYLRDASDEPQPASARWTMRRLRD